MKKTTNLIIIDASGSMETKKEAVVSGLKELLTQIKLDAVKDKKTVKTGTIVIDFSDPTSIRELVNVKDSTKLEDNVSADYKTRGSTALYDAIGKGFSLIGPKEKNVFVSILTDGEENASRELTQENVKELIEKKKKLGWVITFQGTTEAAINNAVSMGVSRGNTISFTNTVTGVFMSASNISNARSSYYEKAKSLDLSDLKSRVSMDNLMEEAAKKTVEDLKVDKTVEKED